MFQVPSGTKEFFCRPSRDFFIWWTLYPAMNGWAIVIASLRDFAAFAPFARNDFNRPLPRSSTLNCHWPPGWDIAGERARPGGRFRRRAVVGMVRCAVRRPALSCPRRAGRNSAGQNGKAPAGTSPRNVPTKAPFVHPKLPLAGAGARPPIGTLLGSAPVPVAVFAVAPKTVFQSQRD
jgi:hypothetical protein